MQIVIRISQELFEDIQAGYYAENVRRMGVAIGNGKVLPKGHGRLIDGDEIWESLKNEEDYYTKKFLDSTSTIHETAMCGRMFGFSNAKFMVQDAPTIIEREEV